MRRDRRLFSIIGGLLALCGCVSAPRWPAPLAAYPANHEYVLAFDRDRDGRADYWQYRSTAGRTHALAYAADPLGRDALRVDLDDRPADEYPHFLIVLDGVPFEVIEQLWRAGSFRLFYPPSRVICCYPSMTDLALADLFHCGPCPAYQALRFDRAANRLSDSSATYLSGQNSPWVADLDYRCSFWWDVLVYLDPQAVFQHELDALQRTFRGPQDGWACGYSVGSAGLGTRGGRPAMEQYLRAVDQLCERIVFERRGHVKITLTADHGHDLVPNRLVSFDKLLQEAGYHPAPSLRGPRDVVTIAYGLVTYAELYTAAPAGVAECLLRHPDVEFACYPEGDAVVVCDRIGQARITPGPGGFAYDASRGDPLNLTAIIAQLQAAGKVAPSGVVEEGPLLEATLEYDYPDPLARVWRAFHGLVDQPPDLIVNLRDGACHGSRFFHALIGRVASTHGSLNRRNSTTFVMTMLGELPPALRTEEVLPALEALRCRD